MNIGNVTKLCKKAGQKLHALARISNLMSLEKRKLLMNSFISSQFSYCPLIWVCHSRKLNNRLNKIHERVLRIVYKDYDLCFEELLIKYGYQIIVHVDSVKPMSQILVSFSSIIFLH